MHGLRSSENKRLNWHKSFYGKDTHLHRCQSPERDRRTDQEWQMGGDQSLQTRVPDPEESVADLTSRIEELGSTVQLENCTAILQLNDNSVYQVGGPGDAPPTTTGPMWYLPDWRHSSGGWQKCSQGNASHAHPLIKALEQARKAFLSPLTRY
jgi:hypothetical protein